MGCEGRKRTKKKEGRYRTQKDRRDSNKKRKVTEGHERRIGWKEMARKGTEGGKRRKERKGAREGEKRRKGKGREGKRIKQKVRYSM